MDKWEYKAVNIEASGIWEKNLDTGATIKTLNRLGDEGWELVSVTPVSRTGMFMKHEATYSFSFMLKRRKKL